MSAQPTIIGSSSRTSTTLDGAPCCNTHQKRLKFFCNKHDLLLCSLCAVKRHRSCDNVLTINEACEEKRNEGRKFLDIYNAKIALIENAIVERKAARKLLETNAQEVQNEIHEITQKFIDLIKHEERMLMENVQIMQNRESEILENDIAGLEDTRSSVRNAHDTISKTLNFNEVDLILAVINERQQIEDKPDVDTLVKKRFREIDFKFVVSPHVSSFLKHFKDFGQVMISEDSGNQNRVQRSNTRMRTPSNEISLSPMSPSIIQNESNNYSNAKSTRTSPDGSHSTVRGRWARDRQRHMQSYVHDGNDDNVLTSYQDHQNNSLPEEQFVKHRVFVRPETPEIYERPKRSATPTDFIARPVSTPPVEENMPTNTSSPKSHDFAPLSPSPQLRFGRSEYGKLIGKQVSATGPVKALPMHQILQQHGRNDVRHKQPVYAFHQRSASDVTVHYPLQERPPSPSTASPPNHLTCSVVSVKEADANFGRSFAAVQISDTKRYSDAPNENISSMFVTSLQNLSLAESQGFQISDRELGNQTDHARTEDNLTCLPSKSQYSNAPDENKKKRWVHKLSFASNGIGSKCLISGIAILPDGRVVLVDQEHYTVQLFDWNFRFVSELTLNSRPFDVISVGGNKIAVSLQSERTLKVFIAASERLDSVADLSVPCSLVCYGFCQGGRNYCVCCGDEIWILSDEGRVINCLKVDKFGNSLFKQAEYVTADTTGNTLFVSDTGHNKIFAIHIDGRRMWEFSYQGFKPVGLKYSSPFLYVCDRDQHRVLLLNVDGKVVQQSVIGRLENPRALCINSSTNQMIVTQMQYDALVFPVRPVHVYTYQ